MRITLNLASKPFIELRPLYARLRWWMAVLLLVAIPLWLLVRMEDRKAALANARLRAVEDNIQRLENRQRSYQAMMQQPKNAAVLTQAVFLNQLFARKAFSWTAIMMDLETVLPGGVQVMSIDPTTDKAGNVTIRLRVNGDRERAVELVRNLEHSRRFLQPRLASESLATSTAGSQPNLQPASASSDVNFDVLAEYNPLEPRETAKEKAADPEMPAAEKATPRSGARHRSTAPGAVPTAPARPRSSTSPARPGASPRGVQ
jgi:type IV pilus assembly protein PilN